MFIFNNSGENLVIEQFPSICNKCHLLFLNRAYSNTKIVTNFTYNYKTLYSFPLTFSQWRCQLVQTMNKINEISTFLTNKRRFLTVNTPWWLKTDWSCQEPMTRSLQLYCVRVTAFSQTDLFLDWISHEWDSHEHSFWTANMKSYNQRKTFCEIFATFKFVIVLLAAQVNRKIESDIEFSRPCDQVTAECLLAKQWSICVKWWQDTGFLFLLVFFFFQVL